MKRFNNGYPIQMTETPDGIWVRYVDILPLLNAAADYHAACQCVEYGRTCRACETASKILFQDAEDFKS